MISNLNSSVKFKNNTYKLNYLATETYTLYEDLRYSIKFMRKMGLPNIGNPVMKFENEVLTLVYSVMQHQINCELYCSLITDDSIDPDLEVQLNSLYEQTSSLSVSYYEYLVKWKTIRDQQKKTITELNRFSIPA